MKGIKKSFLDKTIKVWQPQIEKELTCEDARQIIESCVSYFNLLALWSHGLSREGEQ